MTDPDTERDALHLFEQLLDLAEPDRAAWLEEVTRDRPVLRVRIEALWAAERQAILRTGAITELLDEERAPDRIGAYRITGLIGRGGMGSVYRGERDIGDFAHVVAIKLVKPGLLSEALSERFQRERRTLAALSHPGIAQLYDGGEIDGAPYFVMEYVDGLPMLDWAAQQGLDSGARLTLFAEICAAVAFAHRNLVIHRDLTPSNVLVTHAGKVKLIDFGIARPADTLGTAPAGSGSLGTLSLTPGFAAPERLWGSTVTTATDIFSLGRLLERLMSETASGPELEAIIGKATAAEPAERYPTVDALVADVLALRDNYPVAAMQGGALYHARKLVRRNRLGVAAGTVAAVLLIAAFAAALVARGEAQQARIVEAQRFEQVRSLANYLLFDLNAKLRRVAGNTGARAELAREAQRYLDILAASSGDRADLTLDTARGLVQLGRILGSPNEPNLGEGERAAANFRAAQDLLARLPADYAARKAPVEAEARALHGLILLHDEARQKEAEAQIGKALAVLDAVAASGRDPAWHEARRTVRKAQLELADLGGRLEQVGALTAAIEADIAAWPLAMGKGSPAALDRAYADHYRGLALAYGDPPADFGLAQFQKAQARFDALAEADPNNAIVLYMSSFNLMEGFAAASRAGEEEVSDRLVRRAAAVIDRLVAIDDRDQSVRNRAGSIRESLAQNLRDQGRFGEAIALQRQVVALRAASLDAGRKANAVGNLGFSQMILGIIARDAGDRELACASWSEAVTSFAELEQRGQLIGFMKDFVPGLRKKQQLCRDKAPLSALAEPIR